MTLNLDSRELRVQEEFDRLLSAHSKNSGLRSAGEHVVRFFIRLLRIAFGFGLVLLAIYFYTTASEKTDIPLASLTLADLGKVVLGYVLSVASLIWAFFGAFGPAPKRVPVEDRLREEAEQRVRAEEQEEIAKVRERIAKEKAEIAEAERIAALYRRSKVLGLLSDPFITRKHKWLPWVVWLFGYLILFLAVALITK